MGFFDSIFGSPARARTSAEQWLDRSESNMAAIRNLPKATSFVKENVATCNSMAAAAFVACSFGVSMFANPANERCKRFMDSVRETAVRRYGEGFRGHLRQCGHFTSECNSVGEMCKFGQGGMMDRLIPAMMVLHSVWLVDAVGGNPDVSYKFTPAMTPKTMFGSMLHCHFEDMMRAFTALS